MATVVNPIVRAKGAVKASSTPNIFKPLGSLVSAGARLYRSTQRVLRSDNFQPYVRNMNYHGMSVPGIIPTQTKAGPGLGKGGSGGAAPDFIPYKTPDKMKFNLPPHKWSLPVNPGQLSYDLNRGAAIQPNHGLRRARMWYYAGATGVQSVAGLTTPSDANGKLNSTVTTPQDNLWGFQFLWNPTQFSNTLNRNSDVVPSPLDSHGNLSSLFTAMEAMSFTIIIDRVNDFACAKALQEPVEFQGGGMVPYTGYVPPYLLQDLATKYYSGNGYPSQPDKPENPVDQLDALMRLGTMADIEYLYRMINGSGQGNQLWTNSLGKKTADVAFLAPTAIALQLGPTVNNLSYVGWVNRLDIVHNMFTESMIPIHSEVTVSLTAFSQVSLSTGGI